jgi:hypothetical protein
MSTLFTKYLGERLPTIPKINSKNGTGKKEKRKLKWNEYIGGNHSQKGKGSLEYSSFTFPYFPVYDFGKKQHEQGENLVRHNSS